jgi:nicotinamide-nucleotide amidase
VKAEIMSCGTELLLGHIVDTNAAYLAQQLPPLGVDLYYISQVGDNQKRCVELLQRAWERSDLIIMTGGVGPTEDDLTRESIAELVGETIVIDPELEREQREFWARRNRPMPERNIKQAAMIPSARSLPNPVGTAPGWWVEKEGRIIIAMPGVPSEMFRMWKNEAEPRLLARLGSSVIRTRILKVIGVGESAVEEMIQELIRSTNPTIATYAKVDGIHVRISAKADDTATADALIAGPEHRIREILGEHVYGVNDETFETIIGSLLREAGLTIAVAESATGGLVASALTDVPGCSDYFRGGLVAYSDEMLHAFGVPREVLAEHGSASLEVASHLATVARQRLGTDIGVGITGDTNTEGITRQNPGHLHVAIDDRGVVSRASESAFGNTRPQLKQRCALAALDVVRKHLQKHGVA